MCCALLRAYHRPHDKEIPGERWKKSYPTIGWNARESSRRMSVQKGKETIDYYITKRHLHGNEDPKMRIELIKRNHGFR